MTLISTESSSNNPIEVTLKARKKARLLLMQALYQWQMHESTGIDLRALQQQFHQMNNMERCDVHYFDTLLFAIPENIIAIETAFTPYLDRTVKELNPIECALLRLGTYELLFRLEIPSRVILNEAVYLAKEYGSEEGYKYVNGVLNKVARATRPMEF